MASAGDGDRWEIGADSEQWGYRGQIYLWGAGIDGDTVSGDDIDIDFGDLITNLDFAFMGTLAAGKDKWALFADLIYLNVSKETSSTANIIGIPVRTNTDVTMKGFITTLGGAYNVFERGGTRINALAGLRYLSLKTDLDFTLGNVRQGGISESGNAWDGVVGLRGKTDLSPRWYLNYYGDIGTGDSRLTWQANAGINYRFEHVDATLGYRYLRWETDQSGIFDNLALSGPYAGVSFRW
jgi:hypothetical protein